MLKKKVKRDGNTKSAEEKSAGILLRMAIFRSAVGDKWKNAQAAPALFVQIDALVYCRAEMIASSSPPVRVGCKGASPYQNWHQLQMQIAPDTPFPCV
jgi:hypothetical protein